MPRIPLAWVRSVALATTMTFVFAMVIGLGGFVARQGTVALGASTTLSIISGAVSVRASDAESFAPVADGALLRAGMAIQTGADTYAVLTYFEGSTVSIEPNTTLVIEALEANPDGTTVIAMRQELGRTWHAVAKLLSQGSKYEVRTPTATATVRGTMFAVGVEVDEQGELTSTVETTEGAVATAKAPTPAEPRPQEVVVQPGFQVTVKRSAPIEQPKPAPEPERKVTVTVGASAGLVVDPVGRANGITKDGKVVVQTPGATVSTVDGKIVVTLPKIPDGKIATVIDPSVAPQAPVEVVTTVRERGRSEQRHETQVQATTPAAPAVTAVEVNKGETPEIAKVTDEQKKDIASSVKVAEAPKPPAVEARKAEESKDRERKEEKREGPGGPGGPAAPGGFVPKIELAPLPVPGGDLGGAPLVGKRPEPAKEQPKQEASTVEPPRAEPPKAELPKVEPAKAEPPRNEAPKADQPKPEAPKAKPPKSDAQKVDAPKQDAPKQGPPKADAPKLEQPKQEAPREKDQPSNERSGFVPSVDLPSLPFGSEASAPKKEEPAHPASDGASGKKDEAGTKKPGR